MDKDKFKQLQQEYNDAIKLLTYVIDDPDKLGAGRLAQLRGLARKRIAEAREAMARELYL